MDKEVNEPEKWEAKALKKLFSNFLNQQNSLSLNQSSLSNHKDDSKNNEDNYISEVAKNSKLQK